MHDISAKVREHHETNPSSFINSIAVKLCFEARKLSKTFCSLEENISGNTKVEAFMKNEKNIHLKYIFLSTSAWNLYYELKIHTYRTHPLHLHE